MPGVSTTSAALRDDSRVSTIGALVRAAHAVPGASVTLLIGAATVARGAGPAEAALAVASTAASQLSVGWSNDFLDLEEDRAAGRTAKPLVSGEVAPGTVWAGARIAAAASVGSAAALGIAPAGAMAVALAAAWGYNLGLKRTPLSWLPYAVAFGLASVFVWLVADGTLPPGWVPAATAGLGVAGHLTNVLPDLEVDRGARARGLPHLLGPTRSLVVAAALLGATLMLVLVAGARVTPAAVAAGSAAGLFIVAVVAAGLTGRPRLAFLLTIAAVAAVVATFLFSFPA
jgi:4-hydroxybenzoate polyprenyltransferase